MDFSSPNIKKFLYSLKTKLFLYFLIFPEMKPCTSQPKLENLLYFRKWKPPPKKLFYFLCFENWTFESKA